MSKTLRMDRCTIDVLFDNARQKPKCLVYTPPEYDRSRAPLPVLYLYHQFYQTRTSGRLREVSTNLGEFACPRKAVPMIVVVPDAHALPPEVTPMTNPDFWVNFNEYWAKNQSTADQELFKDIIPFIQKR